MDEDDLLRAIGQEEADYEEDGKMEKEFKNIKNYPKYVQDLAKKEFNHDWIKDGVKATPKEFRLDKTELVKWGYSLKNIKEFIMLENAPIDMPKGEYSQDFIDGVFFAWKLLKERRNKLAGDGLI